MVTSVLFIARHRFGRKEAMTGRPHPETTRKEAE